METAKSSKNGANSNDYLYAFDELEVDPSNRTCSRDGVNLPVSGKVYDILLAFVENPGRLLTKDELIERVWSNEFVEEGNLARNVSTLRKVLGDTDKQHRYIATVPGHGYRFVGEVSRRDAKPIELPATASSVFVENADRPIQTKKAPTRWVLSIVLVIVLLSLALVASERFLSPSTQIKSIAVLPLKRLDSGDNYLGIGIADAVIRKLSQSRQLTTRPTSAVFRFANSDIDTLAAGRELNTDAVLEGNIQSANDRLRVSINLLRTADGSSLWADNFDLPADDVFAIQDRVAQQVATRLQLHIDPARSTSVDAKRPANVEAYEFYIKGIFSLDQRGSSDEFLPQMQTTIDLLKSSIEADPNFALSHAQLAWAYVWTAQFIDAANPKWADDARQELELADQLDPNLAESHQAKAMLAWSRWGNFQYDAAIRELRIAQHLNPSTNHGETVGILGHLGLEDEAVVELNKGLEIDPASKSLDNLKTILPFLRGDADGWFASRQNKPRNRTTYEPWYYLRKNDIDTAKKAIDERTPKGLEYPDFVMIRALYLAQKGEFREATSKVPAIIKPVGPYDQERHHITYTAACIYALARDSGNAVKWLRETANTGFPNYPLFARDSYFDRIRESPEFVQFLAEQKAQWERFKQEFTVE